MGLDIKSAWKGFKDFVMPYPEGSAEGTVVEDPPMAVIGEKEEKKSNLKTRLTGIFGTRTHVETNGMRKVVNGAPIEEPYGEGYDDPEPEQPKEERPKLVLHQAPRLKVRVYEPSNFDQAAAIADDLRDKTAVVVNYERVEVAEQRRICDFINGCCYVTDGGVKRISDMIVLYVPEGVNVSEAMSVALEK